MGRTQSAAKYCWSQIKGPRRYLGEKLEKDNLRKVKTSQLLWLGIIADYVSRRQKLRRFTLGNVISELNKCDVKAWLAALDTADGLLLQSTCDAKGPNLKQWETAVLGSAGKAFCLMKSLLRLLTTELRQWFVCEDVAAFRKLHQVFAFPLRLNLQLEDLEQTALNSWIDAEKNGQAMPGRDDPEKAILREWFPKAKRDLLLKHFEPHHGPGSVFEFDETVIDPQERSLACKYLTLQFNPFQREFIKANALEENIGHTMMQSALPVTSFDTYEWDYTTGSGRSPEPKYGYHSENGEGWTCEVVFVAKSWKTYRTISKEHATQMWLQQGVREAIDWWLTTDQSQASRFYKPGTDDVNRILCQEGSIDGFYATYDLTAASDSVSWALVQDWYAETSLEDLLYSVRTPYAREQVTGSVYLQSKYAPMGSAVCFPILSMTMAAICESRRRLYVEQHNLTTQEENDTWPWFHVFGDDIICRYELAPLIEERLVELGFRVNLRKSYYRTDSKHYYRESCGVEYLDGQDVSVVKLPRPNFEGFMWTPDENSAPGQPIRHKVQIRPSRVSGLVGLANNLEQAGLKVARWMIIYHLLSQCDLPIVFSEDGRVGLRSVDANNRHLEHIQIENYQREFYRGWKLVTLPKGQSTFSELRYDEGKGIYRLFKVDMSEMVWNSVFKMWQPRSDDRYNSYSDWTGSSQLYEWMRTHRSRRKPNPLDAEELTLAMDKSTVSYLWYGLVDPESLGGLPTQAVTT